jgi:hypothetical protein
LILLPFSLAIIYLLPNGTILNTISGVDNRLIKIKPLLLLNLKMNDDKVDKNILSLIYTIVFTTCQLLSFNCLIYLNENGLYTFMSY